MQRMIIIIHVWVADNIEQAQVAVNPKQQDQIDGRDESWSGLTDVIMMSVECMKYCTGLC